MTMDYKRNQLILNQFVADPSLKEAGTFTNLDCFLNICRLIKEGQNQEASKQISKYIGHADIDSLETIASLCDASGLNNEHAKACEKIQQLDPKNPILYIYRAKQKVETGKDCVGALSDINAAIESTNKPSLLGSEYLVRAEILLAQNSDNSCDRSAALCDLNRVFKFSDVRANWLQAHVCCAYIYKKQKKSSVPHLNAKELFLLRKKLMTLYLTRPG